jgi:hypothetical protein
MAKHLRRASRARRLGRSVAVVAAAGSLLTASGVAFADTVLLDGDSVGGGNAVFSLANDNCDDTVTGDLTLKYNGNASDPTQHFKPGEALTVVFYPESGSSITVTGPSSPHVPAVWDKDSADAVYNFTTDISNATADDTYQVAYTVVGAESGYGVGTGEASGRPHYNVSVDCVADTVANHAPVVDAAGPYSGNEGSAVNIAGTATDADAADTLTYAWSYTADSGNDAGSACTFGNSAVLATSVTCNEDGSYTLTLSVSDGHVASPVTDTATLTVGNVAPSVTATPSRTGACSISLNVSWTDPGSIDTHNLVVNWGDSSSNYDPAGNETSPVTGLTHTFAAAGTYNGSATVTDDDNGSGSAPLTGLRAYNTPSGILQPINLSGQRSSFKLGSTIPVKITVTGCDGNPVSTLTPSVNLEQNDTTADGAVNEAAVSEVATNGKLMRWDVDKYIYNLSTKNSQFNGGAALTPGTYTVSVNDPTFAAPVKAAFDVKK